MLEAIPVFSRHHFIRSSITVFLFHIGFLRDRVQIFMHRLQQYREHLTGVMLSESLELNCFTGHPTLHIPWGHISAILHVHILKKVSKGHCQSAPRSICIFLVNVLNVDLIEEELHQRFCIGQTLQNTVHETSVSQVLQPSQPTPQFFVLK